MSQHLARARVTDMLVRLHLGYVAERSLSGSAAKA